jgi:hypothetical protein
MQVNQSQMASFRDSWPKHLNQLASAYEPNSQCIRTGWQVHPNHMACAENQVASASEQHVHLKQVAGASKVSGLLIWAGLPVHQSQQAGKQCIWVGWTVDQLASASK